VRERQILPPNMANIFNQPPTTDLREALIDIANIAVKHKSIIDKAYKRGNDADRLLLAALNIANNALR
jgi:hypothetical protein